MSGWRPWLFRVASVVLAVTLAFGLVELALWLVIPASTANLFFYQPGTQRQKLMKPNVRATVYGVPIETNESGYRARRSYTGEKGANVLRIIALGDSFLVSAGVPFEDLLTTRLERRLDDALLGAQVEIYNLAVAGHEILHHAATLEEVGLGYSPDLILLFLYPFNDLNVEVYDQERRYMEAHAKGDQALPLPSSGSGFGNLRTVVMLRRQLVVAARRIELLRQFVPPLALEKVVRNYRERTASWQRSFAALQRMAGLAAESGIPLQIVLLPSNVRPYRDQRELYELAQQMAEEAEIPVLSLLDRFVGIGRPSTDYALNLVDSHPNREYNALAARMVGEHLLKSGILEGLVRSAGEGGG